MWQPVQSTRATWRSGSVRLPEFAWPVPLSIPMWQSTHFLTAPTSSPLMSLPRPGILWLVPAWQEVQVSLATPAELRWTSIVVVGSTILESMSPRLTPSAPPAAAWHFVTQVALFGRVTVLARESRVSPGARSNRGDLWSLPSASGRGTTYECVEPSTQEV